MMLYPPNTHPFHHHPPHRTPQINWLRSNFIGQLQASRLACEKMRRRDVAFAREEVKREYMAVIEPLVASHAHAVTTMRTEHEAAKMQSEVKWRTKVRLLESRLKRQEEEHHTTVTSLEKRMRSEARQGELRLEKIQRVSRERVAMMTEDLDGHIAAASQVSSKLRVARQQGREATIRAVAAEEALAEAQEIVIRYHEQEEKCLRQVRS